jgi:hypothetical protein
MCVNIVDFVMDTDCVFCGVGTEISKMCCDQIISLGLLYLCDNGNCRTTNASLSSVLKYEVQLERGTEVEVKLLVITLVNRDVVFPAVSVLNRK